MSNRINKFFLQFNTPSFTPVSGAISGVTPKVSSPITCIGVESITMNLATTGTVNGLWTVQVSNDAKAWIESAGFASQPTYPTGVASSGNVTVPTWGYQYMQITFTPSAGAGNATATLNGKVQSIPFDLGQNQVASLTLNANATDTIAGTWLAEVSNNWSGGLGGSKGRQLVIADGNWNTFPASPALAAKVASTAQNQPINLGVDTNGATGEFPYLALRLAFTPTAGAGGVNAYGWAK